MDNYVLIIIIFMALTLLMLYIFAILYYRYRPVPRGVNPPEKNFMVESGKIRFLYDLVWKEGGEAMAERHIFEAIRKNIQESKTRILFDVFLFNQLSADYTKHIRVTDLIISDFEMVPSAVPKIFITDPLNIGYGTNHCASLTRLQKNGVKVIFTNLDRLPDNNLFYSGFWRLFFQWFGTRGKSYLPYPNEPQKKTTFRALLKALNIKANHRKLMVCDDKVILTSSNLHDSSSNYSNTGLEICDTAVTEYYIEAEKAVAKMSGQEISVPQMLKKSYSQEGDALVTPLLGLAIKRKILDDINQSQKGDEMLVGMLFVAHRKIIKALKKAMQRGVKLTFILDNNLESFDQKKLGIPNAYIIPELIRSGAKARWFNNMDDEYHTKFVFIKKPNRSIIHIGSANLTRRSLMGGNLENNVRVEMPNESQTVKDIQQYASRIIQKPYSIPIDISPNFHWVGYLWCRIAERIGLATW